MYGDVYMKLGGKHVSEKALCRWCPTYHVCIFYMVLVYMLARQDKALAQIMPSGMKCSVVTLKSNEV